MTKIKICGLMSIRDAELLNELKVDYGGVVMFFSKSHRSRTPEQAKEIIAALDKSIKSVAVVVAPTAEQIKVIEECGFDIIQVHGELTDEAYNAAALPIFKAFNVKDIDSFESVSRLDKITGYVFDAAQPGSGKTFDWSLLKKLPCDGKLMMLAGGLTADNAAEAIRYLHPDAVDVSSGVENDDKTGKSRSKAESFVNAVRER